MENDLQRKKLGKEDAEKKNGMKEREKEGTMVDGGYKGRDEGRLV